MNTVNNAIVTMLFNHIMEDLKTKSVEEIKELKDSKAIATTVILEEKCMVVLFPNEEEAARSIHEHKAPEQYDFVKQEGRTVKAQYAVPADLVEYTTELHIAACKMVEEIQGAQYVENPQDFYLINLI